MAKKKKKSKRKFGLTGKLFFVFVPIALCFGYFITLLPNTKPHQGNTLFIRSNAAPSDVIDSLKANNILRVPLSFELLFYLSQNFRNPKPGKYVIDSTDGNIDILNKIYRGLQTPTKLILPAGVSLEKMLKKIASQVETSEQELMEALEEIGESKKISPEKYPSLFIPNTYEIYWTVSAKKILKRIHKEYDAFWKKQQSKMKGFFLNQYQVITLASIIEKESNQKPERPTIAGVYINRLKSNHKLEADPTINFIHDYQLKRILNKHIHKKSPYNTYLNRGLPPGPICIPSRNSIKSVINYQKHEYMFFCAREDFSGNHAFAKTYSQHLDNAKKYQRALSKLKKN